jgi:hypothetical protein
MIIDTPTNIKSKVTALQKAGVVTTIRYECRPPGGAWKRLQPDEAQAIGEHGMYLGVVYEASADPGGYQSGELDGAYALNRMQVYGQPTGSAVYFAVDEDASEAQMGRICSFFEAVRKTIGGKLRVGCYGSGAVNAELLGKGLIDLRWITCSTGFRGTRAALANGAYELWQYKCDTTLLGVDVDLNRARVDDIGVFVPFGHPPAPSPQIASADSPGRQTGITATVFGGPGDEQSAAYPDVRGKWWTRPGVALPYHFSQHPRPRVRVHHGKRAVVADIVDVGPHHTDDPYWQNDARPQAESEHGNHAGIDLTPALARQLGVPGKATVDWEFA